MSGEGELSERVKNTQEYGELVLPTYASPMRTRTPSETLPAGPMPAQHAKDLIVERHALDFNHLTNTSSYVNVVFEPEELEVLAAGAAINLADQTVYPESFKMHNEALNMIATMWNCPKPTDFDEYGCFAGAGTVGSTEACLLAGLALKFRWRAWYAARAGKSAAEVRSVLPNLVISTQFQACWEKLFKYFDIEPRFVTPPLATFTLTAEQVVGVIDEHTIGVVCIMGNHYGGHYDPVGEVSAALVKLNAEKGFQVGIHVDGASGGFIAPFQSELPPWDFRCESVLSISASGHKFGQSVCGTGWVVWRQREGLSSHVAISVSYLGGKADSYTLNFSRPASGSYVQYYKFLRLGRLGYAQLCANMMANAKMLRDGLRAMTFHGKPRFEMLDHGDTCCLPVVTARLNPALQLPYDDIDLQHALGETMWYVSGYAMSYHDPLTEVTKPLFADAAADATMFRVVVKSNLTATLAANLLAAIVDKLAFLDTHAAGYLPVVEKKKIVSKQSLRKPC